MANTPDLTSCPEVGPVLDDAILPVNPFLAVRYQFGMLLGVDDFDTAEAYPRGKTRLHNAWLHGAGAVWGLDVRAPRVSSTDPTLTGEIEVGVGLALDRVGHELHLDQPACVDMGAWYAQHQGDADVKDVTKVVNGTATAQLHVEMRFRACLTRQVPAMSEPCDGAGGASTAYSRAFETVELKVVAGKAPSPRIDDYPLLRLLFRLRDDPATATRSPDEKDVIAARDAGFSTEQAFLAALRKFAVRDEIAMSPGTSKLGQRLLFPGDDDSPPVILADLIDVVLAPQSGGGFKMTAVTVDTTVRRVHIATSTIQELHCCASASGPSPEPPPTPIPTASAKATLNVTERTIRLVSSTRAFDGTTVDERAILVTQLTKDGWAAMEFKTVDLDVADTSGKTILIGLRAKPSGSLIRFIGRGTGSTPLMYAAAGPQKSAPFRGANGAGSDVDGSDFVFMWEVP